MTLPRRVSQHATIHPWICYASNLGTGRFKSIIKLSLNY